MSMNPRLLRPTASGFNPKSIAGLVGWWDAADAASVTLASGFVSQINDKSGLGYHATQTTPNNRPGYASTINGRNIMTFDGVNDRLVTGLPSNSLTGFPTFLAVCRVTSTLSDASANNKAVVNGRDADTNNAYGLNLTTTSPSGGTLGLAAQWRNAGFNFAGGPALTKGVAQLLVGGITSTGRVRRVNGAGNTSTGVATTAGTNAAAGRFLHIGEDVTQSRFWEDAVCEVCVYSRQLTTAELGPLERYLGTKWGITIA